MFISAWFYTGLLDFTLSVVYGGKRTVKHGEGLGTLITQWGIKGAWYTFKTIFTYLLCSYLYLNTSYCALRPPPPPHTYSHTHTSHSSTNNISQTFLIFHWYSTSIYYCEHAPTNKEWETPQIKTCLLVLIKVQQSCHNFIICCITGHYWEVYISQ